jgi:hypothetical protein
MKVLRIVSLILLCGIAVGGRGESKPLPKNSSHDDGVPKTIAESVGATLQFTQDSFLALAEAMPEDKYSFVPTAGNFEGVRSFGEQMKHVACGQFAFFNEFEGKTPPADCEKGGHDPAKTKAELVKYLEVSFDYASRVVATLTEKMRWTG